MLFIIQIEEDDFFFGNESVIYSYIIKQISDSNSNHYLGNKTKIIKKNSFFIKFHNIKELSLFIFVVVLSIIKIQSGSSFDNTNELNYRPVATICRVDNNFYNSIINHKQGLNVSDETKHTNIVNKRNKINDNNFYNSIINDKQGLNVSDETKQTNIVNKQNKIKFKTIPYLKEKIVLLNINKLKSWSHNNLSFDINIESELPMVPVYTQNKIQQSDGMFSVFTKTRNSSVQRLMSRTQHGFIQFNPSNPGNSFSTHNAFGIIKPMGRIYLKTDNIYWCLYNDWLTHISFNNNIFNYHKGFRNTFTFEYFFYNILNEKNLKYKSSLLLNYNYISNKECKYPVVKTSFPEIKIIFENINSKIKGDVSILPGKKNKLSFNLACILNSAGENSVKSYENNKKQISQNKNIIYNNTNNTSDFASVSNSNTMNNVLNNERQQENSEKNTIIEKKKKSPSNVSSSKESEKTRKRINSIKQKIKKNVQPKGIGDGLNKKKNVKKKSFKQILNQTVDLIRNSSHYVLTVILISSICLNRNLINEFIVNEQISLMVRQVGFGWFLGTITSISLFILSFLSTLFFNTETVVNEVLNISENIDEILENNIIDIVNLIKILLYSLTGGAVIGFIVLCQVFINLITGKQTTDQKFLDEIKKLIKASDKRKNDFPPDLSGGRTSNNPKNPNNSGSSNILKRNFIVKLVRVRIKQALRQGKNISKSIIK